MINLIFLDASGHKVARRVNNREEYFQLRNTEANRRNFLAARSGDQQAKKQLVQFNYNDTLPDGVLKGCRHSASTLPHDIDCQSREEQQQLVGRLMDKRDDIGLLEDVPFWRTRCVWPHGQRRRWTPRLTTSSA